MKRFEIVAIPLCQGSISKYSTGDNMKKIELNGYLLALIMMLLQLIIYKIFTSI